VLRRARELRGLGGAGRVVADDDVRAGQIRFLLIITTGIRCARYCRATDSGGDADVITRPATR
jgi:hypothetical protein